MSIYTVIQAQARLTLQKQTNKQQTKKQTNKKQTNDFDIH